ncbi:MAG: hypothetical protein ACOC8H_01585 [bacterium]
MVTVEVFDTAEDAWAAMEQARKAADARVRPWQADARPGDCFVHSGEGLVIYGEVLECYDDPRLKHYRFCRCYSAACPRGELGDVHVSVIERFISREEFEQARDDLRPGRAGGNPGSTGFRHAPFRGLHRPHLQPCGVPLTRPSPRPLPLGP